MNPVPVIEPEDYRQQVTTKWLLLVVLGSAVFANSVLAPFLSDDLTRIESAGSSLAGQRLSQATLVLNRVVDQPIRPRGFHLVNLILHALSGLVLFGLVCRTLLRQSEQTRLQEAAPWAALVAALLWMVHPLHTQTVTAISSRADLVAGLCLLLTLYATLRGAEHSNGPLALAWYAGAVVACAVGMGEAPVMVLAPLAVLLYDRTYLADSWQQLFRQRRWLYVGLAACWGLLALSPPSLSPEFLGTQPGAIVQYLRLTFWPVGLCYDYSDGPRQSSDANLIVVSVLLLSGVALFLWRPKLGYPAVFAVLTLLPASLFASPEWMREPRMYLPLAGISVSLVLVGLGMSRLLEGWVAVPEAAGLIVALPVIAVLGTLTFQRNTDYTSPVRLWETVLSSRPENGKARLQLAGALFQAGEFAQAVTEYRRLSDTDTLPDELRRIARRNLPIALALRGDVPGAIVLIDADESPVLDLNKLGLILSNRKNYQGAEQCYRAIIEIHPRRAEPRFDLALMLQLQGRTKEAAAEKAIGLEIDPDFLKPKR